MIFYSQTSNGIAFLIDENASSEIAGWNKGIQLTSRQLASLQSAGNPTPNYSLRIILLAGEIILEVARDTVGRATIDRFKKLLNRNKCKGHHL